jgi:hypothetical protein
MRKVELSQSLAMKLNEKQRKAIENLADQQNLSLAQAARFILDQGLKNMEIKVCEKFSD